MKKISIEYLKDIAKSKKGVCLSSEYLNYISPMVWRCQLGHVWTTSAHNIMRNSWCPKCSYEKRGHKKRIGFKEINEIIENNKGELIGGNYRTTTSPIICRCSKGHDWKTTGNRIKAGHWCPVCSLKKRSDALRSSIEDMHILAMNLKGKCLSLEYRTSNTKLTWQCEKGHVWDALPASVQQGHWCIICAGKKKYTIEYMRVFAEGHGGKCLSDKYENANSVLLWQCEKGHKNLARFADMRDKWACSECSSRKRLTIEKMQELASLNGGKCLSMEYVNNRTILKWKCKNGHEFWMRQNSIKSQGSWCPICIESTGEWLCREIFENIFKNKFPKVKPPWLKFRKLLELDGYCEELGIAFEYNGLQHYKRAELFHQTDNDFKEQRLRDRLKKRLCKEKGVKLIIIPQFGYKFKGSKVTKNNVRNYILKQLQLKGCTRLLKKIAHTDKLAKWREIL